MQMQSQGHSSQEEVPPSPAQLPAPLIEVGSRHGFGADATRALWSALVRGHGGMAQFSHAEFGGSGQWMRGGTPMIGDMFNRPLADRVGALAEDLARWLAEHPELAAEPSGAAAKARGSQWWPEGLHSPSTSGAQNGLRYAYFPDQRRLAIERGGAVEVYDTDDHLIGGVSQQQGGAHSLAFTSQRGVVEVATLRRIGQEAKQAPDAPAAAAGGHTPANVDKGHGPLETLEKLAALHQRGVLTDAEFTAKKTELLGRL